MRLQEKSWFLFTFVIKINENFVHITKKCIIEEMKIEEINSTEKYISENIFGIFQFINRRLQHFLGDINSRKMKRFCMQLPKFPSPLLACEGEERRNFKKIYYQSMKLLYIFQKMKQKREEKTKL